MTAPSINTRYSSADGRVFTITGVWTEESGVWVKYTNADNIYTCRFEAFQDRFHLLLD